MRRGADLSDGGFQLDTEGVVAAGVDVREKILFVLQLHCVEVWQVELGTKQEATKEVTFIKQTENTFCQA